ncbi:MAG TPA: carboxypeptidase-like regulatory domain-containing protein [Bryobacteraceae bacterium]
MTCNGGVTQKGIAIRGATVQMIDMDKKVLGTATTNHDGDYVLRGIPAGSHYLRFKHFFDREDVPIEVIEGRDCDSDLDIETTPKFTFSIECDRDFKEVAALTSGNRAEISFAIDKAKKLEVTEWKLVPPIPFAKSVTKHNTIETIPPAHVRELNLEVTIREHETAATTKFTAKIPVWSEPQAVQEEVAVEGEIGLKGQPINVRLNRTASDPTLDQALWVAIRNRSRAISFDRYQEFMNLALRWEERPLEVPSEIPEDARGRTERDLNELGIHMHGVNAYQVLKHLTELFLLLECGIRIVQFDPEMEDRRLGRHFSIDELQQRLRDYLGERAQLPYITRVVRAAFPELLREGADDKLIGAERINEPCLIELIWSYWMEEGMLVRTMNAITRRFQNIRAPGERDPLANLEIDPLRPLNNLLWGYIQDEHNRLSVLRRAFEYDHQYGLTLYGGATAGMQSANGRSKFLEAFHNLLHQAAIFFKEDFPTTVIVDGFPLLNSLREIHLILASGAGNQFGDLAWTARTEMLLTQYMLARPEIQTFLKGRTVVPYREPWEGQVDTMKTLQGWTDVTVSYLRDLAVYGEQLLLAIRHGDWIADYDEYSAINWARYFRPEIQGYMHAYRAATGIDLANSATVDATIPGILLQKRTPMQGTK